MKLHELDAQRQTKNIAKVFESFLGTKVNFDNMGPAHAKTMLQRVRRLVREHQATPSFHTSEKNPSYLKLIMLEQALSAKLSEMDQTPQVIDTNDPKVKQTMQKASNGQTLNPEEQKTMNAIALMKKEGAKTSKKRMVKESELQQAQVVLAAQDMVDQIQKMMEQISEMQFKDLPALTSSIKNDMGIDQANQFQGQATAALTQLLAAVQQGKTALEGAQGVLTGQAPTVPGQDDLDGLGDMDGVDGAVGDDFGAGDVDVDADVDVDVDDDETDAQSLGRERR